MIVDGLRGACNVGIAASQTSWHTNLSANRKISVLLGQVGLIADTPDERADVEHMLGFPTRSVKFNERYSAHRVSLSTSVFAEVRIGTLPINCFA
jgi:hypothetical protein